MARPDGPNGRTARRRQGQAHRRGAGARRAPRRRARGQRPRRDGAHPRLPQGQGAAADPACSASGRSASTPRRSRATSAAGSGTPRPARASTRSRSPSSTTTCRRARARTGASRPPSRCSRSPSPPTGRSSRCRSTRPSAAGGGRTRSSRRCSAPSPSSIPVEGRPAQAGDTVVVDLLAEDGSAQRDYVVELGSERLVEEIENGDHAASAPARAARSPTSSADGSRRSATVVVKEIEGERPAAARRRAGEDRDRVRHARRAARRHRGPAARADRRRARRARSAPPPSTSSSRRRTSTPRGPLVELRTRELLNGLARSLEQRGIDAGTYLQLTGQTIEQLNERLTRRGVAVGRRAS